MVGRLPDLVVIGAPKAGTTSLARWLSDHPDVRMSATKELEFFDLYFDRGLDWYAEQLPPGGPGLVVGEATPTYLGHPLAPTRAAQSLPAARFVAVLREPVSRAWSNYWFFCQLGLERRSWASAVRAERKGRGPDYLGRGRYAEQVARWDAVVDPDRLLLLLFDDLVADPAGVFARVCRFAGVRDDVPPTSTRSVNPTSRPRSRHLQYALHATGLSRRSGPGRALWSWNARGGRPPTLPREAAAELRQRYAADNAALADRLGTALPAAWKP